MTSDVYRLKKALLRQAASKPAALKMAGRVLWIGSLRGLGGGVEVMAKKYRVHLTPEGRVGWTLQMLADQLVKREIVDTISTETVRWSLKKPAQALVEGMLVYSAQGQCRIRVRHGGRAGGLPLSIRGRRGAGLLGRLVHEDSPSCPFTQGVK